MAQDFSAVDDIDRQIIALLAEDARLSIKELAAAVGLSSPSVSERLKRLTETGVIRRFTVDVAPKALGYQFQAIVRIRPLPGKQQAVEKLLREMPEVIECDKVTGDDCFIARMHLRDIEELDSLLEDLTRWAETNSSLVKAMTVPRRLPPLDRD